MSYITTPTYGPRNPVTCIPGWPTLTTCKLGVFTLYNPATYPLVVVVNGESYTGKVSGLSGTDFQMTAVGTDHPNAPGNGGDNTGPVQVGWSGVLTVTGLTAWTSYTWSVSQNGETDSGSLKTAPTKADAFRIEAAGCDNNTVYSNSLNATPWNVVGYWQHIKTHAQADGKTAGVFFVDDLGYVDTGNCTDTYADGTGMTVTAAASPTYAYNLVLNYFMMIGMLGPSVVDSSEYDYGIQQNDDYVNNYLRLIWGREENRAWCRKNLNVFPQFGDHEYGSSDPGFDLQLSGVGASYPNIRWLADPTGAGGNGNGWVAWHSVYGLLQPTYTGSDTLSNHWCAELGNLTLFTLDGISRSDSVNADDGLSVPTIYQINQLFGTTQITDILTSVQTYKNPFVLCNLQFSIGYLSDLGSPLHENSKGAQHPIRDHCPAEYSRLFTATGQNPKSLMDSNYTNGLYGTLLLAHGDHHHGQVVKWESAAYGGTDAAENFYSIQFGTTNGSVNFDGPDAGTSINGGTVEYSQVKNAAPLGNHQFHGAQFYVTPEYCAARLADWDDETKWTKTFWRGRGNSGYAESVNPAFASIGIAE